MKTPRKFAEFFAGSGMARAGLAKGWQCVFANDIDERKCESYSLNWGDEFLHIGDVGAISTDSLPKNIDLAWASFPCQDLSQAGAGAGLMGGRSGVFWPFWKLLQSLPSAARPPVVVLENVQGAITSHQGRDFTAICEALSEGGYRFGAVLLDAALFVPQSRVRLFIIAVAKTSIVPTGLYGESPTKSLHSNSLIEAVFRLPDQVAENWLWWRLPAPARRTSKFSEILCSDDALIKWHLPSETDKILAMMSPLHIQKIEAAKASKQKVVGSIYKRRRANGNGEKVQRAEVRFDDIAGCLRTPTGGSSRQTIILVDEDSIRTRILQPREAARLMGLDDDYILPENYYEAYHLVGDGVAVPVVRYLAENLLEPILDASPRQKLRPVEVPRSSTGRRVRINERKEPATARFCWQRRKARRRQEQSR